MQLLSLVAVYFLLCLNRTPQWYVIYSHCVLCVAGCNENSETGGVETLLPSVNKARLGQRSKGRAIETNRVVKQRWL